MSRVLGRFCSENGEARIRKARNMNYFREAVALFLRLLSKVFPGEKGTPTRQMLNDVLAEHADSLVGKNQGSTAFVNEYPNSSELLDLLPLAEHTCEHLAPVVPTPGFKNRLLNDLMRQAHTQQEEDPPSLWREKRREIIIGATITSAISAAGVVAYLMHITPFNRRSPTSASEVLASK